MGLAFLHRLVVATHLQFGQASACGVDQICAFLKMVGLGAFVAASHGAQQAVSAAMQGQIVAFGETQRRRLAAAMQPRQIALCEDETFHPEVCLVAMEPASGYILLERYAEARDAATWTEALQEALEDLPVEVVIVGSDEAAGLVAQIERGLGAHQAPDLFHVQRELWKALGHPLARSLDTPKAALAEAEETTALWETHRDDYWSSPRPPGRLSTTVPFVPFPSA